MRQFLLGYIFVLIAFSCNKDRNQDTDSLQRLIVGEWEEIGQKGFPYSRDTFEIFPMPYIRYHFEDDGTFGYRHLIIDDQQTGSYEIDNSSGELLTTTNDTDTSVVTVIAFDFNNMTWQFDQRPEGTGWKRLIRVD